MIASGNAVRCHHWSRLRALVAAIGGLSFATVCPAAEFKPFDGPKLMAVFIQSDPWATVVGADTPRVAVYESGEYSIFVSEKPGGN